MIRIVDYSESSTGDRLIFVGIQRAGLAPTCLWRGIIRLSSLNGDFPRL
jgi:hypothetical protein